MFFLPSYVKTALFLLEEAGHHAYCVGGCIRDSLLNKTPKDWDIATSALPEETLACFSQYQTVDFGTKHGTVGVIIDSQTVEITTFRLDGDYTDSRHPKTVTFTADLTEDLSRRDFTINAMAWREKTGLVDLFGGQDDLHRGVLRCVGQPRLRFTEDALRILRCARFCAQLGFSVEEDTAGAARTCAPLLAHISEERVAAELSLLLCGAFAEQALRSFADVLFVRLPALHAMTDCTQENPYHIYTVWEHSLHAIGKSPKNLAVRLALLFHDSGKPAMKTMDARGIAHFYRHAEKSEEIARDCLTQLRFPNKLVHRVCRFIALHDQILPIKKIKLKRLLGELGAEDFFALLDVIGADISAQAPFVIAPRLILLEQTRGQAQELFQAGACLRLTDLAVNGRDLQELGVPSGAKLGELLQDLFELVLLEQVENTRERLLQLVKRRMEKNKL